MLRKPDGYLRVQGQRVYVLALEVHLTRAAKSDTMHATLSMSYLPEGLPFAWWCETTPIEVEAFITLDGEEGEPLFMGTVSQVEPNWAALTFDVRGHDKTTDMMESRSPGAHRNKRGGEVIEAIAKKHGLTVEVEGDTQKAGRLYDIDHVHLTDQMTDWDVVNYLAEAEGLVPSVKGKTLHLNKDDEDLPILQVEYEPPTPQSHANGTFIALGGIWNLDQTGETKVKVHSWDHKTKKKVEVEKKSEGQGGRGVLYEYRVPGLKQDRASRIAQRRLSRATGQERGITVEVPGDPRITARMVLDLRGTQTAFDQRYPHESAEHRINVDEGYRCHVTAKGPSKKRKAA